MFEIVKEFYLENKPAIDTALSTIGGCIVGWITAFIRTRKSRLENTFNGLKWYDEDDLVFIDGKLIPLNTLTIVKKGKNADEN